AAYRAALTFSSSLGAVSLVGDMVDGRLVIDLGEKFPSGRYELAVRGDDNQLHNGGSATVGGMTFVKGLYISGAPTTTDSAVWRFSSTVPSSPTDPSSGKLTLNNSSGPLATSLCISDLTDAGTDVSSYLSSLQAGDVVYLQDQSDASKWLRYNLTTAAVDHTYWHELGVSYVSGPGGSITNNSPLLVTLTRTGGGGGGAGYTDAQAQDAMAAAFAAGTHSGITFSYNTTTNAMSATVTAGGVGTVTSVAAGTGLTASPSPITGAGTLSLVVPVTVANGGTGATTASAALTALGGVPTTRTLATTAPLAGGGDLSANRTLTVSTFTSGTAGVVPASGGGTTNFLRADGTWAAPPGGGGSGTVTSVAAGTGLVASPSPITTSGTISLVTPVAVANGGTNLTTYATGDLVYASASNVLSQRTIGASYQGLEVQGGVPVWSGVHACRAWHNANQSISAGTWTQLSFSTDDGYAGTFDTDNIHSMVTNLSRMTVPASMGGKWRFLGFVQYTGSSGTTFRSGMRIIINGSQEAAVAYHGLDFSRGLVSDSIITDAVLAAGDYAELGVFYDGVTGFSIASLNPYSPVFIAQFLGP
ncbi:MAG TPA: hypothetical protein VKD72_28905, partial [Gemmataceae bacterium]|nr:hypothetical protein [Gemmataceae bacterium]